MTRLLLRLAATAAKIYIAKKDKLAQILPNSPFSVPYRARISLNLTT